MWKTSHEEEEEEEEDGPGPVPVSVGRQCFSTEVSLKLPGSLVLSLMERQRLRQTDVHEAPAGHVHCSAAPSVAVTSADATHNKPRDVSIESTESLMREKKDTG